MFTKLTQRPHFRSTLCLCIIIVLSLALFAPILSKPEAHRHSLSIINDSKNQATALSLTVTLASTAITMLPDDYGSAIADELSELSTPLLIIVCILFFEQYLLTAMEGLAFGILIPFACVCFIVALHSQRNSLKVIGYKLLMIAILCAVIIPLSAVLTHTIRDTFAENMAVITTQIDEISLVFNDMLNADDVLKFLSSLASGVGEVLDFAKDALGLLIDAVAILLITSCVIPVITAILFIWCIKSIITGHMENLEDTAMSVLKKIPPLKKHLPPPENPDESAKLTA